MSMTVVSVCGLEGEGIVPHTHELMMADRVHHETCSYVRMCVCVYTYIIYMYVCMYMYLYR